MKPLLFLSLFCLLGCRDPNYVKPSPTVSVELTESTDNIEVSVKYSETYNGKVQLKTKKEIQEYIDQLEFAISLLKEAEEKSHEPAEQIQGPL